MKYTVITTFNESGHKQYGQRMIDTFESKWPSEVDLMVCTENCAPKTTRPNTHVRDLLDLSGELNNFISRHKHNPLAHGRAGPPEVFDPKKHFGGMHNDLLSRSTVWPCVKKKSLDG